MSKNDFNQNKPGQELYNRKYLNKILKYYLLDTFDNESEKKTAKNI